MKTSYFSVRVEVVEEDAVDNNFFVGVVVVEEEAVENKLPIETNCKSKFEQQKVAGHNTVDFQSRWIDATLNNI